MYGLPVIVRFIAVGYMGPYGSTEPSGQQSFECRVSPGEHQSTVFCFNFPEKQNIQHP